MTKELETGGPMFPTKVSINRDTGEFIPHQFGNNDFIVPGGSIRTYAAIHLGVPMSEHEFINDMIRERQRNELAKAAMQTLLGSEYTSEHGLHEGWQRALRYECFQIADAMLAEQEKK